MGEIPAILQPVSASQWLTIFDGQHWTISRSANAHIPGLDVRYSWRADKSCLSATGPDRAIVAQAGLPCRLAELGWIPA